jgi:hypothetical protein
MKTITSQAEEAPTKPPLDLHKFLAEESSATPDRSGRTPLVALSESLSRLSPVDTEKLKYVWAAEQVLESIDSLPPDELRRLFNFIQIGNFPMQRIAAVLAKSLRTRLDPIRHTERRAMVLSWLTKLGCYAEPRLLRKEQEVRARYPWHWIDAMCDVDWDAAVECATEQLQKSQDASPLLARLAYFWKRQGEAKCLSAIQSWLAAANDEAREKLLNWARRHQVEDGLEDQTFSTERNKFFLSIEWSTKLEQPEYTHA